MCENMQIAGNQGSSLEPWYPKFLLGFGHKDVVSLQPLDVKADTTWPKAFNMNHIVRLSGMAQSPQINKDGL